MEVNETMQKLKVPQNYAPYLQKMGIYDFFYVSVMQVKEAIS